MRSKYEVERKLKETLATMKRIRYAKRGTNLSNKKSSLIYMTVEVDSLCWVLGFNTSEQLRKRTYEEGDNPNPQFENDDSNKVKQDED